MIDWRIVKDMFMAQKDLLKTDVEHLVLIGAEACGVAKKQAENAGLKANYSDEVFAHMRPKKKPITLKESE